jgi:hypothetical protein
MSTRLWPAEFSRLLRGWVLPAAMLALAPKCVLCVLAYAGLGAAIGLGAPELCGATGTVDRLPLLLGSLAATGFLLHRMLRRSSPTRP